LLTDSTRRASYSVVLCYESKPKTIRDEATRALLLRHTRLTHWFLLRGEDVPMCAHCDSPVSVDCPFFQESRDKNQLHGTIREILQDNRVFPNQVLAFLNCNQVYGNLSYVKSSIGALCTPVIFYLSFIIASILKF
jgi:hypothetical protein